MTTTTSYQYTYYLGGFDAENGSWDYASLDTTGHTLSDDETGGDSGDGIEMPGETLGVSMAPGWAYQAQYSGWSYDGNPIVYSERLEDYYLYANGPGLITGGGNAEAGDFVYATTTETYAGFYQLSGFNPATGEWLDSSWTPEVTILGDDETDRNLLDGSAGDGSEAAGELLTVHTDLSDTETYTGWTYNGDPIMNNGSEYYLYSNDPTEGGGSGTQDNYFYSTTPTTTTYAGQHYLMGFDPDAGTWSGSLWWEQTYVVGDDETDPDFTDGSGGDGVETQGEAAGVQEPPPVEVQTYTGWTYGDGVITVDEFGNYLLHTNDPSLDGASGEGTFGDFTYCFARGTTIATPEGECTVDTLSIGDVVTTAEGKHVPVKWIGRQTRHPLFAKMNGQLPVRIKASALGDGLPVRDLYVSPDHAMLVDGVLVHALALVNGVSIVQMQDWHEDNVEYFHIELENHDLVLAEGAPAETFVDNVSRKNFDNYGEYVSLYGESPQIPELPLPRVKNKRQLSSRTKRRLMGVAMTPVQRVA